MPTQRRTANSGDTGRLRNYLLKAGQHYQADYAAGKDPETKRYPTAKFVAGDIVESHRDLVAEHGTEKFQLLGDSDEPYHPGMESTPKGTVTVPKHIDSWGLEAIKQFAADNGIETFGANTKQGILAAIKNAANPQPKPVDKPGNVNDQMSETERRQLENPTTPSADDENQQKGQSGSQSQQSTSTKPKTR